MSYSFTEKKRIRKSFASRPSVLEVPSLLDIQLRSYEEFLQANVAPNARNENVGLQAAFKSMQGAVWIPTSAAAKQAKLGVVASAVTVVAMTMSISSGEVLAFSSA